MLLQQTAREDDNHPTNVNKNLKSFSKATKKYGGVTNAPKKERIGGGQGGPSGKEGESEGKKNNWENTQNPFRVVRQLRGGKVRRRNNNPFKKFPNPSPQVKEGGGGGFVS